MPNDPDTPATFAALVSTFDRGLFDRQATAALAECLDAVRDYEKPATLTVTFTFGSTSDEAFNVAGKLDVKLPKPAPAKPAIYFRDADGNLTRRHPHQHQQTIPGIVRITAPGDL